MVLDDKDDICSFWSFTLVQSHVLALDEVFVIVKVTPHCKHKCYFNAIVLSFMSTNNVTTSNDMLHY